MASNVYSDTKARLEERYGDLYASENCQTIGCIFKKKKEKPLEEEEFFDDKS